MTIKEFTERWLGHGYEKGEAQTFWIGLLRALFEVEYPEDWIVFEDQINGKFIDARIPLTHVLIEQKSLGRDLEAAFEQAKEYDNELPYEKKSRWIITSDFAQFRIHDMNNPAAPPEIILLKDLPREAYRLKFLVDENSVRIQKELEISLKAGRIVRKIYDSFLKSYIDPTTPRALDSLNKLCIRLVFCLYAEDSGCFGKNQFYTYLNCFPTVWLRRALILLFRVLELPASERDPYLEDVLRQFPYVDGNLFAVEDIEIPRFTDESRHYLLCEAVNFDWSGISPTIFGALFESNINPETRRLGGMHYTSIENIHKVIDPLFMNDLRAEFDQCGSNRRKLLALQDKLAALTFFDPACGSGNFLTETYLSLRRLENEILKKLLGAEIKLGDLDNPIKVSIESFYGVEINDFACAVANVAMIIAESQMMIETQEIIHRKLEFLPIKHSAHITRGNALHIDWKSLAPPEVDYIIGNPPFVGFVYQSVEQKADMQSIFPGIKNLDYVSCWFKRAADFMVGSETRAAFVATNSITQGETAARLRPLLDVRIDFAHRSFKWGSEIKQNAAVHCVVIGFSSAPNDRPKYIFDGGKKIVASNINWYLLDAPDIVVTSRNASLCDVPTMTIGNLPRDGGHLLLTPEERDELIRRNPLSERFIRPLLGAKEFLNGLKRYCLWLVHAAPNELKSMPRVMKRIKAVREWRLSSKAADTRKDAEYSWLFARRTQPEGKDYILVPQTSSENRRYVPMGFMSSDVIVTNAVQIIPEAGLYHFGVLESIVHMAWLRAIGGRLEVSYRYSRDIVYNNFPWCTPTEAQRLEIERTAQGILDVRAKYPNSTLAELYDETLMPRDLRAAHDSNDRAVLEAYGFDVKWSEAEVVGQLMTMYQRLIEHQD